MLMLDLTFSCRPVSVCSTPSIRIHSVSMSMLGPTCSLAPDSVFPLRQGAFVRFGRLFLMLICHLAPTYSFGCCTRQLFGPCSFGELRKNQPRIEGSACLVSSTHYLLHVLDVSQRTINVFLYASLRRLSLSYEMLGCRNKHFRVEASLSILSAAAVHFRHTIARPYVQHCPSFAFLPNSRITNARTNRSMIEALRSLLPSRRSDFQRTYH